MGGAHSRADGLRVAARGTARVGFPALPPIPTGRYTDPHLFRARSATHIWKTLVAAGRAATRSLEGPGSFQGRSIAAAAPLLIWCAARTPCLRAFYNTCQHRGAPVVREACGVARAPALPVPQLDLRPRGEADAACRIGGTSPCSTESQSLAQDRPLRGLRRLGLREPGPRGPARFESGWDRSPTSGACSTERSLLRVTMGVRERARALPTGRSSADAFLETYHLKHDPPAVRREGCSTTRGAAMGLFPRGHSRMVTPKWERGRSGASANAGSPFPTGDRGARSDLSQRHQSRLQPVPQPDHAARHDRDSRSSASGPMDAGTTDVEWTFYGLPCDADARAGARSWQMFVQNLRPRDGTRTS